MNTVPTCYLNLIRIFIKMYTFMYNLSELVHLPGYNKLIFKFLNTNNRQLSLKIDLIFILISNDSFNKK